jgi:starch phosphorylase
VPAGDRDRHRAAERLASRLPDPLRDFARLAYNYHWSWQAGGDELFEAIDPERWRLVAGNPVRLLEETSPERLAAAAAQEELLERLRAACQRLDADLARAAAEFDPVDAQHPLAFMCAEFAVHASLPIYSGGLGALAGDFLKQASDDALPFVGVGLLYRQGYFRQRVDATGLQHEYWVDIDPERLPAALVTGADGAPLSVTVPIADEQVRARIWRVEVGRVPLYLLDSDCPENSPAARWITSRLYIGDRQMRLAQYLLLGVGGVRALAAVGVDPARLHLNEGHPAFAALELARPAIAAGAMVEDALADARERIGFTTHTPVPAGNDTYPVAQVTQMAGAYAAEAGIGIDLLARLGRPTAAPATEPFGLTQFALRSSSRANAVSARHGEVARAMWQPLWPERAEEGVPIGHVTNGVHEPTWVGEAMRGLFDRHLGDDWLAHAANPAIWKGVPAIPASELWAARSEQRARLVELVRERSVFERLGRGDTLEYAEAAAAGFDPDTLTIGFARRLATYKRLGLLVADAAAARALLSGAHPIQIVLAGKAHPSDEDGKRMLRELFALKPSPEVGARVVFLEDYDLASAATLVQGCDVWLNLPRPPLEASGTSGMKAAINGGLHLSVLDGWWAEAYDGSNGWALSGEVDSDAVAQDRRDAAELQRILSEEVVPLFWERGQDGIPHGWIERIHASLRTLGPTFSAQRMLADYRNQQYRF